MRLEEDAQMKGLVGAKEIISCRQLGLILKRKWYKHLCFRKNIIFKDF